MEPQADGFSIAVITKSMSANEPNELRMCSRPERKMPKRHGCEHVRPPPPASLFPLPFPESCPLPFHSQEREPPREQPAVVISVCRDSAFRAGARASVCLGPPRKGGGGVGGSRHNRRGGGGDSGAAPGRPGRGRKQDCAAV